MSGLSNATAKLAGRLGIDTLHNPKIDRKGLIAVFERSCRASVSFDAAIRSQASPSASYTETLFSELPLDRLKIEDAKPIFVFDSVTEFAFLRKCGRWAFPIHFTLAKTGLRIGELVHLLIEEMDLDEGWLQVRIKTEPGWRVKPGRERSMPLIPEVVSVLRTSIGVRRGVVASANSRRRSRFLKSSRILLEVKSTSWDKLKLLWIVLHHNPKFGSCSGFDCFSAVRVSSREVIAKHKIGVISRAKRKRPLGPDHNEWIRGKPHDPPD